MSGASPSTPINEAEVIQLQERALELRLEGLSYRAIAAEMRISKSRVERLFNDAWARTTAPRFNELMRIDLAKLEQRESRMAEELILIRPGADPAMAIKLTQMILNIISVRAKIGGYMVQRVSLVDDEGAEVKIPEALAQALRHVEERNAEREAEIRGGNGG